MTTPREQLSAKLSSQFADGDGGLRAEHVGPTTTVITALPRKGDAIVEMDGQQYACWFRNLGPFPARIIVVHESQCGANFDDLDNVPKIADLGLRFLPKGHKIVCSRLKRIVAKYGEFAGSITAITLRCSSSA